MGDLEPFALGHPPNEVPNYKRLTMCASDDAPMKETLAKIQHLLP